MLTLNDAQVTGPAVDLVGKAVLLFVRNAEAGMFVKSHVTIPSVSTTLSPLDRKTACNKERREGGHYSLQWSEVLGGSSNLQPTKEWVTSFLLVPRNDLQAGMEMTFSMLVSSPYLMTLGKWYTRGVRL